MDTAAKVFSDFTMRHLALKFMSFCCVLAPLFSKDIPVDRGQIEGAFFAIARPVRWNQSVLLLAHGSREDPAPLVANLDPKRLAYKTLIDEGWIVAATSYRRNGIILADAIKDLDNLRAYISEHYGVPERVILEGESLGGMIVTLMAERPLAEPPLYAGAVAIGAALNLREPASGITGYTTQTKIPMVFLTNRSELDEPRRYVNDLVPSDPRPVAPALFVISRDGHVNVNQPERLGALQALLAWIERGRDTLPKPEADMPFFDATQPPPILPSQVVRSPDERGFAAKVTEVVDVYGNVALNAQPSDFASVGILKNAYFQLIAHEKTFRVLFGKNFNNVKRGEWIAFPNADGFFWVARNFANAAESAHLEPGDEVIIRSLKTEAPEPPIAVPSP